MTGKQEDTALDLEETFNEGCSLAKSESDEMLREQIAEEMVASWLDPDEVEQALFSDNTDVYAPRRGRRSRHRGFLEG